MLRFYYRITLRVRNRGQNRFQFIRRNCQVAVSVHHVGEQAHTVLGWRLYLPESWAKDRQRREEAGIPQDVEFQTKWQLGLDIIDQVRGWGLADRIVVTDAAYGDATEFRDGLESRRLLYIVGISSALGVWTRPPTATVQHVIRVEVPRP